MSESHTGNDCKRAASMMQLWRDVALVLAAMLGTGVSGWLLFGVDNVKHGEMDAILATRAPYIHDKQRIQENLDALQRQNSEQRSRITDLERRVNELDRRVGKTP